MSRGYRCDNGSSAGIDRLRTAQTLCRRWVALTQEISRFTLTHRAGKNIRGSVGQKSNPRLRGDGDCGPTMLPRAIGTARDPAETFGRALPRGGTRRQAGAQKKLPESRRPRGAKDTHFSGSKLDRAVPKPMAFRRIDSLFIESCLRASMRCRHRFPGSQDRHAGPSANPSTWLAAPWPARVCGWASQP